MKKGILLIAVILFSTAGLVSANHKTKTVVPVLAASVTGETQPGEDKHGHKNAASSVRHHRHHRHNKLSHQSSHNK